MENIEQRTKSVIAEHLGYAEAHIKGDQWFITDLAADSLDSIEIVMALEDEFEIEVTDEEIEAVQTVQQAIDLVKRHLKV